MDQEIIDKCKANPEVDIRLARNLLIQAYGSKALDDGLAAAVDRLLKDKSSRDGAGYGLQFIDIEGGPLPGSIKSNG